MVSPVFIAQLTAAYSIMTMSTVLYSRDFGELFIGTSGSTGDCSRRISQAVFVFDASGFTGGAAEQQYRLMFPSRQDPTAGTIGGRALSVSVV